MPNNFIPIIAKTSDNTAAALLTIARYLNIFFDWYSIKKIAFRPWIKEIISQK